MKRIALLVAGLVSVATVATAGQNWQTFTFNTTPADLPKILAALEELMKSTAPGEKGSVSLMANVAGGDYSHTFISAFDSRADREVWAQKLQASQSWTKFTKTTQGIIERGSSARMNIVKSWGTESDKDVLWEIYAFRVDEPDDLTEALDKLLASDTGKKFPGQVYLSEVAVAGMAQATHLISVGYESEAESETWNDTMLPGKDWEEYQDASEDAATFVGAYMIRTIKTWGGAN